jgi:predicted RNA-binding Zn-ribbon protein involved in translation (DUF1610 family)
MFCLKCGAQLPNDGVFCYKCGAKTTPYQGEQESTPSSQTVIAPSGTTQLKCPSCGTPIAPKFGEMIIARAKYDHRGNELVLVVDGNSGGLINSIGLQNQGI